MFGTIPPFYSLGGGGGFGITGSPSAGWVFNKTAETGAAEVVATFGVSDALISSGNYLRIANRLSTDSRFAPEIIGSCGNSNLTALHLTAQGTTDSSGSLMAFNARIGASSSVVTRPLAQWQNNSTTVMTLAANGGLTINGGTAPSLTVGAAPTVYTSVTSGGRVEYTSTSSTRANAAFEVVADPSASSSGVFTGAWCYAESKSGNAQNLTASVTAPGLIGVRGQASHAGSGTATAVASVFAGTIGNSGGGNITIACGLLIAAQTAATNNWGIYQAGTTTPNFLAGPIRMGTIGGPLWQTGAGTPEGVLTAPVGSLYTRTDGGASTTLYVKESGTGNTGWIAK